MCIRDRGSRHAERGELSELVGLDFVEPGVGSNHGEGGVAWGGADGGAALHFGLAIDELTAAGGFARAGDDLPGGGVAHVAKGVDGDQGGDQHAAGKIVAGARKTASSRE